MNNYKANWAATIVAILIGLAGLTISVIVTSDDDGQGHSTKQYKFEVNKKAGDGAPTKELTVPVPVVEKVATQVTDKDLRDETPELAEQVAPGELTAAQEMAVQVKATQPPLPTAGASQGFIGCRTQFVQNQSSRHGVRPIWQVLHYTVSKNILGWADVNSIVAFFNKSATQASSTFVIDAEGNCAYIVPIEAKSWTQAAGNPLSISYEVINYGNELSFMTSAGYAKLRSVMEQVSARTGIPMRRGSVYPARSGIVQHADGGYAWGGHHDIGPFPMAKIVQILVKAQPVPQKVKWSQHLVQVHNQYQSKCKHAYQRERRPVTCAKLRKDGKTLRKLIARK